LRRRCCQFIATLRFIAAKFPACKREPLARRRREQKTHSEHFATTFPQRRERRPTHRAHQHDKHQPIQKAKTSKRETQIESKMHLSFCNLNWNKELGMWKIIKILAKEKHYFCYRKINFK
jgi:hypothetical protein